MSIYFLDLPEEPGRVEENFFLLSFTQQIFIIHLPWPCTPRLWVDSDEQEKNILYSHASFLLFFGRATWLEGS